MRWPSLEAWRHGGLRGRQCCRICRLQPRSLWARRPLGSPWYLGLEAELWADGCTHDEPSRLITWAMMLSDVLCCFCFCLANRADLHRACSIRSLFSKLSDSVSNHTFCQSFATSNGFQRTCVSVAVLSSKLWSATLSCFPPEWMVPRKLGVAPC